MGVACDFTTYSAQPETFGSVIAGGFEAAIIKGQNLGPAAFQKQLSVVGTCGGGAQNPKRFVAV
jgi:hypothetical protein